MRSTLLLGALAGLAIAAPKPQDIDFDEIASHNESLVTGPDVASVVEPVNYDENAEAAEAADQTIQDLEAASKSKKRSVGRRAVDVNAPCAPQPNGHGPKPPTDTVDDFLGFSTFAEIANHAPTPQGYTRSFVNLQASSNAKTYLGLYTLKTYDTIKCQQLCDAEQKCGAFNIYFERDPTVNPNREKGCPDPQPFTNIKCTLWGSEVTPESALNRGQYRTDFQVVITGSNGYGKHNAPPPFPGFDGPMRLGGAIKAPGAFIRAQYFAGPYDANKCIAACKTTTAYNSRHRRSDGTYDACNFVNAYLLSIANVPDGTYCSMYTKPWDATYGINFGQHRSNGYYSVSNSYSYTLSL